jgi:hypothetical protein
MIILFVDGMTTGGALVVLVGGGGMKAEHKLIE